MFFCQMEPQPPLASSATPVRRDTVKDVAKGGLSVCAREVACVKTHSEGGSGWRKKGQGRQCCWAGVPLSGLRPQVPFSCPLKHKDTRMDARAKCQVVTTITQCRRCLLGRAPGSASARVPPGRQLGGPLAHDWPRSPLAHVRLAHFVGVGWTSVTGYSEPEGFRCCSCSPGSGTLSCKGPPGSVLED